MRKVPGPHGWVWRGAGFLVSNNLSEIWLVLNKNHQNFLRSRYTHGNSTVPRNVSFAKFAIVHLVENSVVFWEIPQNFWGDRPPLRWGRAKCFALPSPPSLEEGAESTGYVCCKPSFYVSERRSLRVVTATSSRTKKKRRRNLFNHFS